MRRPARSAALVLSALLAAPAWAQDVAAHEAAADGAMAEEAPERPARPLGWLSDPDEPPADLFEALVSGKIHLNNRFRVELAKTAGRDSSTAITNRIRLGYETKPFHGFSGLIEMENVWTPDKSNYFVPATGQGTPTRTVVADPTGTEVNRAQGRFHARTLGDSAVSLDVTGGRQRIQLDDDRFVGNVGWRQFEQTFDAVRVGSNLGVEGLLVEYAYVWGVQRIFGPDGPNWDSDSHLLRASYAFGKGLTVTPFAYLLDFRGDSPRDSSDSYGVRLTGAFDLDEPGETALRYELTYARQTDAGSNPVSYDADFFAAEAGVSHAGTGALFAGYQFLGSDGGEAGFRFPLGTNHRFQGFADVFLVTPDAGLQDLYAGVDVELPWGVKGTVVAHQFWSERGGRNLGRELDAVLSKALGPNWSVMVKGAFFDGKGGEANTTRVWVQTEVRF